MRLILFILLSLSLPVFAAPHILEKSEGYEALQVTKLSAAFFYLAKTMGLRGTHSKGVCAGAQFDVKDLASENLPASVRETLGTGMFAKAGSYPARLRFANAASKVASDGEYDGRALSFAVDLGYRGRQDFVVQNSPVFPIPSLEDFVLLLGHVRDPSTMAARPPEEQARLKYMLGLAKTFSPAPKSYLTEKYWSGTAFALGERDAVKYIVVPCAHNSQIPEAAPGDDFLGNALRDHLSSEDEMACFDFRVQILNPVAMTHEGKRLESWQWVENPTLTWSETEAPSYSVATLTLKPGSVLPPEACDARSNAFGVMSNSLPEHRGLGRINRGRSWPEYWSGVGRSF